MLLTAKQIIEKKIIALSDENAAKYGIRLEPAQVGIDLHVISCAKLNTKDFGIIYPDNAKDENGKPKKTKIAKTEDCKLQNIPGVDPYGKFWILEPGDYEIGFAESCNFADSDGHSYTGKIVHRSSLRRCGGEINSPLWDPSFTTGENEMGTFMHLSQKIKIYLGARVAQIFVMESDPAPAYSGQFNATGVLHGQH